LIVLLDVGVRTFMMKVLGVFHGATGVAVVQVARDSLAALDQRVLRVLWRGQVHFRAKKQVIRGHIWG
jgi:hypothetical protein